MHAVTRIGLPKELRTICHHRAESNKRESLEKTLAPYCRHEHTGGTSETISTIAISCLSGQFQEKRAAVVEGPLWWR